MKKMVLGGVFVGALLAALFLFQGTPSVTAGDDYREELAQILKNQEKILQTLEEIKADLVKIRVRSN